MGRLLLIIYMAELVTETDRQTDEAETDRQIIPERSCE